MAPARTKSLCSLISIICVPDVWEEIPLVWQRNETESRQDTLSSLVSFILYSVFHSFFSQTPGRRHLGNSFYRSVTLNIHISPHSTDTSFSLTFLNPLLSLSLIPCSSSTHKHTQTPRSFNYCKQQIVVNASPRLACCGVLERKKHWFMLSGVLINLLGFFFFLNEWVLSRLTTHSKSEW